MPRQMKVRARTLQPGGPLVHDVFAPEDSGWRAAAEFWLFPLAGDVYFSDLGREDDWLSFCEDVAKQPTDNFAIVECALRWYSEYPDGGRARQALVALERLADEFAERNANALQRARDMIRRDERGCRQDRGCVHPTH